MKKKIDLKNIIYFFDTYPICKKRKMFIYNYTIGIGGNVGNVILTFKKLYKLLFNNKINIEKTSIIFKNPPFGYLNQPHFYNSIIEFSSNFPPKVIFKKLQFIENRFKRIRIIKNGPRTIDLDIIFIKRKNKDLFIYTKDLIVPHPKWSERESVLIPLMYLC